MKLLPRPYNVYILLTLAYFSLVIFLPADKLIMQMYHLTASQYHVLLFILVLPLMGIWLTAFYGYQALNRYVTTIESSPEGKDFRWLANGCKWLAYGLPVLAIFSLILTNLTHNFSTVATPSSILKTYLGLLIPLIAFSLLARGTRGLATRAKISLNIRDTKIVCLLFVLLGVAYCYLTFQQFELSSLSSTNNAYYMPVWLVILTVIVPYLYTWFIGLLAAYELLLYARFVKGVLYKQALLFLSAGLVAVIISSIGLQYITSVIPQAESVSLSYAMVVMYISLLISAGGYILVALGAKKLKRIEEV